MNDKIDKIIITHNDDGSCNIEIGNKIYKNCRISEQQNDSYLQDEDDYTINVNFTYENCCDSIVVNTNIKQ